MKKFIVQFKIITISLCIALMNPCPSALLPHSFFQQLGPRILLAHSSAIIQDVSLAPALPSTIQNKLYIILQQLDAQFDVFIKADQALSTWQRAWGWAIECGFPAIVGIITFLLSRYDKQTAERVDYVCGLIGGTFGYIIAHYCMYYVAQWRMQEKQKIMTTVETNVMQLLQESMDTDKTVYATLTSEAWWTKELIGELTQLLPREKVIKILTILARYKARGVSEKVCMPQTQQFLRALDASVILAQTNAKTPSADPMHKTSSPVLETVSSDVMSDTHLQEILSKAKDSQGCLFSEKYRVVAFISKGGFWKVYKAQILHTGEYVALKIPSTLDTSIALQLQREIDVLLKINNPRIVRIRDWSFLPEAPVVVMDYVQGISLKELIQQEKTGQRPELSLEKKLKILEEISRGVEALHAQSAEKEIILHRDITPGNIMINPDQETVTIIDFGLAKIIGPGGTFEGSMVGGTLAFAPPEQLAIKGRVDQTSDVYSLGRTAYYFLTGVMWGDEGYETADQQLPAQVRVILHKAFAPEKRNRYPTVAQLCREWEQVRYGFLRKCIAGKTVQGAEGIYALRELGRYTSFLGQGEQKRIISLLKCVSLRKDVAFCIESLYCRSDNRLPLTKSRRQQLIKSLSAMIIRDVMSQEMLALIYRLELYELARPIYQAIRKRVSSQLWKKIKAKREGVELVDVPEGLLIDTLYRLIVQGESDRCGLSILQQEAVKGAYLYAQGLTYAAREEGLRRIAMSGDDSIKRILMEEAKPVQNEHTTSLTPMDLLLQSLRNSTSASMRLETIQRLSGMGANAQYAVSQLLGIVKSDEDRKVREAALDAIEIIAPSSQLVDTIFAVWDKDSTNDDGEVGKQGITILIKRGYSVLPHLVQELRLRRDKGMLREGRNNTFMVNIFSVLEKLGCAGCQEYQNVMKEIVDWYNQITKKHIEEEMWQLQKLIAQGPRQGGLPILGETEEGAFIVGFTTQVTEEDIVKADEKRAQYAWELAHLREPSDTTWNTFERLAQQIATPHKVSVPEPVASTLVQLSEGFVQPAERTYLQERINALEDQISQGWVLSSVPVEPYHPVMVDGGYEATCIGWKRYFDGDEEEEQLRTEREQCKQRLAELPTELFSRDVLVRTAYQRGCATAA